MNIIANSTDIFNASTHCAHCEKRMSAIGAAAIYFPTKYRTKPIHYFICTSCIKLAVKLKPSKRKQFAQRCEDNLILSASEVTR